MKIGDVDIDGCITDFISTSDKMYCIKERGIYAVQLADNIDPERNNPEISDTQQKIFSVGSESPLVAKTILTAYKLFRKTYLGSNFDDNSAIFFAIKLLEDIIALDEIKTRTVNAINEALHNCIEQNNEAGIVVLPSTNYLKHSFDSFAQKAGHFINVLENIARLFYKTELSKKWITSLKNMVVKKEGAGSPFAVFMQEAGRFLLLTNDIRNMVEHPKTNKRIDLNDFRLLPTGLIDPPTMTIVRPNEEDVKASVEWWMGRVVGDLSDISELLMAHLCRINMHCLSNIPTIVTKLPQEQRRNKNVCFSYAVVIGDNVVPFD
ncbi:MAG: hypothetical protein VB063_05770 [Bacteroides graminisolvens]|nr:hypothetical protein [Bacteroides graminisolvens]